MRERIHDAVSAAPGVHFQELVRRLDVPQGTVRHHLRALEQGGLVRAVRGPGHTCYFLAGSADRHTLEAAPFLRSEGARRILQTVEETPGLATHDLAVRLGMSVSTVHTHLVRLETAGIVDGGPARGSKAWRVVRPQVAAWAKGVALSSA